ncbi:MAG: Uma2 family endonuclease [Oscillospiraceae bacterium]|nr:Uma2 family endonuclease [Oscillospiraceae bacterium]
MDIYMPTLSTTVRHNRIATSLIGQVINMIMKNEVNALSEQCPLAYWGTKELPSGFELVDAEKIDDTEHFTEIVITELEYVKPDFLMFKNNPYLENKRQTRTAGRPDLIVEIWSESNSKNDRAFLQNLYATSDITEHWYIEQDSNEVICYLGRNRLENQYLTDVLSTREGLKFDLRYLAI